jgi:putative flippase GtrA
MFVIARVVKCFTVSVGTTLLSAFILVVLAVGLGVPAGLANVIAVVCGIGPSYVFNRRWVWQREGRGDIAREVVPFWSLSLAGLARSTIAVAMVGAVSHAWSPAARAIALPLTNAAVFGALWLAQFVILDRVIFRHARGRLEGVST